MYPGGQGAGGCVLHEPAVGWSPCCEVRRLLLALLFCLPACSHARCLPPCLHHFRPPPANPLSPACSDCIAPDVPSRLTPSYPPLTPPTTHTTPQGMGPKMLVSDLSTAEQPVLRWRLSVRGNTAVEFGVVPLCLEVREGGGGVRGKRELRGEEGGGEARGWRGWWRLSSCVSALPSCLFASPSHLIHHPTPLPLPLPCPLPPAPCPAPPTPTPPTHPTHPTRPTPSTHSPLPPTQPRPTHPPSQPTTPQDEDKALHKAQQDERKFERLAARKQSLADAERPVGFCSSITVGSMLHFKTAVMKVGPWVPVSGSSWEQVVQGNSGCGMLAVICRQSWGEFFANIWGAAAHHAVCLAGNSTQLVLSARTSGTIQNPQLVHRRTTWGLVCRPPQMPCPCNQHTHHLLPISPPC